MDVNSQRVAVLVDLPNLYRSARAKWSSRVQFDKLIDNLREGRTVTRAIAFLVNRSGDQGGFIDALSRFGYEVRVHESKGRASTATSDRSPDRSPVTYSPEVPIPLTIEALNLASRVDTIVLVSGDSIYVPLVQALLARGCRVEVCAVEGSLSGDLIRCASRHTMIPESWTLPEKEKKYETPRSDDEVQPVAPVINYDEQQPLSNAKPSLSAKPILVRR